MAVNAVLERSTFEISRELEFFSEKELTMQIGHDRNLWPIALLKELIDNALDACEMAGFAPVLEVTATDTEISEKCGRRASAVLKSQLSTLVQAVVLKRSLIFLQPLLANSGLPFVLKQPTATMPTTGSGITRPLAQ